MSSAAKTTHNQNTTLQPLSKINLFTKVILSPLWPGLSASAEVEWAPEATEMHELKVPKTFGELMATVMHELKVPKAFEEL